MAGAPELTPQTLTVGNKQAVVVVFPYQLPKTFSLITLDLFYESTSKRVAAVPCAILGSRTVKAMFPALTRAGNIDVVPKVDHEETSLLRRFKMYVQSTVEAMYSTVGESGDQRPQVQSAMIASILAYMLHTEDKTAVQDGIILYKMLHSIGDMPVWNLSSLICGKYVSNTSENLLHFALRHKLDAVVEHLLDQKVIQKHLHVLQQKSFDQKTPLELAKKYSSPRIVKMIDQLQAEYESKTSIATPPIKEKVDRKISWGWRKKNRKSTTSIDHVDLPLPITYDKEVSITTPTSPSSKEDMMKFRAGTSDDSTQEKSESSATTPVPSQAEPAIENLKKKCLYTALITQNFCWSSSPYGDFYVKVGDRAHVIQETDQACFGIINNCYGRFPRHVIQRAEDMQGHQNTSQMDSGRRIPNTVHTTETKAEPVYASPTSFGRLLPECKNSSSHDSGLDRLGLPRRALRQEIPSEEYYSRPPIPTPRKKIYNPKGHYDVPRPVNVPRSSDEQPQMPPNQQIISTIKF